MTITPAEHWKWKQYLCCILKVPLLVNLYLETKRQKEDGPDAEAALRQYLGLCKVMETRRVVPFCLYQVPDTYSTLLQTPSVRVSLSAPWTQESLLSDTLLSSPIMKHLGLLSTLHQLN